MNDLVDGRGPAYGSLTSVCTSRRPKGGISVVAVVWVVGFEEYREQPQNGDARRIVGGGSVIRWETE